jgi:hypothetical protein
VTVELKMPDSDYYCVHINIMLQNMFGAVNIDCVQTKLCTVSHCLYNLCAKQVLLLLLRVPKPRSKVRKKKATCLK